MPPCPGSSADQEIQTIGISPGDGQGALRPHRILKKMDEREGRGGYQGRKEGRREAREEERRERKEEAGFEEAKHREARIWEREFLGSACTAGILDNVSHGHTIL